MSISKPIDEICKKLSADEGPMSHQSLVRVDKDGEVLTGLTARLKTAHKFAVRNNHRVECGKITIRIRDFVADNNKDIPIRWAASLVNDGVDLMREIVTRNESVEETLRAVIQQVLQEEADKRGTDELGSWAHSQNRALTAAVTAKLSALNLNAVCVLETKQFVSASMEIKTPSFSVRTSDSDRDISVNIDMRIDPLQGQGQSGPKSKVDWDLQIRSWTKDYVERNEILNNVYLDSNFDRRLEDHINVKLGNIGWKIQRFTLKTPRMVQEESLSDIFNVNWTSAKGQTFKFDVKLAIVIEDLGLYDKMGKPSLKAFAQEVLDKSFEAVLFKRDTDSLSPGNFKEVREAVHSMVNATASRYGIGLTTLLPDPAIPEWELLKPTIYDYMPRDYETSDPGSKANFKINLEGCIASIGSAFYATSLKGVSVAQQIEKIATDKAAIVMREIEISDYFEHFYEGNGSSPSVKEVLESAITEELKSRFNFKTQYISILQNDPQMREDLRKLKNDAVKQTNIEVMPNLEGQYVGDDYLVPISIRWRFAEPSRGKAVNLNYRQLNLQQLAESLPDKMMSILAGLSYSELVATTFEDKNALKKRLFDELNADLGNQGVGIFIESVISGVSEWAKLDYWQNKGHKVEELKLAKERQALKHEKLLEFDTDALAIEADYETYQALKKRRIQSIEANGEVEYEVEKKLKELEQKLSQRNLENNSSRSEQASSSTESSREGHGTKGFIE
ncbi:hypothetical protein N474_09590 [Pseudoalteromonas luteoviolacea CPMOR-2]|uniref:hypothetical protein n=1 Tax=Pseudoalteromonas luteoviolacea TaxID=43657 RepID=UPI0007B03AF7|nr:hypothetical protein [Pseudoalteromonas luteoviolacea]KZN56863.1 hypothetical protein N474_09590 [Pseudoalteromonas luteoviolacea CPMOR-2]